jgi:hypothetical protein
MSMDAIPLVRLVFGVLVAVGLYLTYVGWLAKPALTSLNGAVSERIKEKRGRDH